MAHEEEQWLSTGEVAVRLGVSREWVRLLIQRGTLQAQRTWIGFLVDPRSIGRYAAHRSAATRQISREAILDRLAHIRASITGGRELADDSTESRARPEPRGRVLGGG